MISETRKVVRSTKFLNCASYLDVVDFELEPGKKLTQLLKKIKIPAKFSVHSWIL